MDRQFIDLYDTCSCGTATGARRNGKVDILVVTVYGTNQVRVRIKKLHSYEYMKKEYYFMDKVVIVKEIYEVFQLACIVMVDTNEERIVDVHLIKTCPYIEKTISLSVLLGRR